MRNIEVVEGQEVVVFHRYGDFSFRRVKRITPTGQIVVAGNPDMRFDKTGSQIGVSYRRAQLRTDVDAIREEVRQRNLRNEAAQLVLAVQASIRGVEFLTKQELLKSLDQVQEKLDTARAAVEKLP